MRRVALKGLAGRKLRAVLTALAIVLGVALISGSYVLTDSIDKAFHSIFTSSYENTDAVVSGRNLLDWSSSTPTVPASLLPKVQALPAVASAAGQIVNYSSDADTAKILDRNGKMIQGSGNPTFGFGIDHANPRFSPMTLEAGRWASNPHEVVLDASTAQDHDFNVGDRVRVAVDTTRWYTVSGIAGFGDVNSLGGATVAVFDLPTAQHLLHKSGRFDTIGIARKPGVSEAELLRQVRSVSPGSVQVRTGEQQAREDESDVSTFLNVIRYFLLGFGGIALFVGSFVIFNTLSITVAQRSRELATLRTIGASRRQVLRSVLLEAFVLGAFASAVGLALGVALAHGLKSLFAGLGLDLPSGALSLEPRTVIVSLVAGILVTVIAGLIPAMRATRVPPIAAVREGAAATAAKRGRASVVAGSVLTLAAVALLGLGLFAHGLTAGQRVLTLVLGPLALFLGIAFVASRLVRPIVAVVGKPSQRFGGAAGRLAVENAQRNPGRTASTAAALMIGLTLVTFVTCFGKGLAGTDQKSLKQQLNGDYVVTANNGWTPLSAAAAPALAKVPGVELVSAVRYDRARAAGANATVNGVDPRTAGSVLGLDWKQGSARTLASLRHGEAILKESFAKDNHLSVGERITIVTPNRKVSHPRVVAIFKTPKLDSVLGSVLLTKADFDRTFPKPQDAVVVANVRGGSSESATRSLQAALASIPDSKLDTRDGWAKTRSQGFTQILNLFYVLLGLSVIVSLFGMVNTLALSVFERTRELGMLRAVGMTRRQTRRMVRHESVVIALVGAVLGISLGIGLEVAVGSALSKWGFSITVPASVIVFVLAAIGAGVLAAMLPARRASKLNVLAALQYE
jgi:putative ABC transport system permease protein